MYSIIHSYGTKPDQNPAQASEAVLSCSQTILYYTRLQTNINGL